MKKKGFTLIELLAVIIILAIVALVATPIILNVVNDAKKSAGLSEAKMIYSGINNYCEEAKLKEQLNETESICKDGVTIEEVNQMVNLGNAKIIKLTYANRVIELTVESNGYTYTLKDGEIVLGEDGSSSEEVANCTYAGELVQGAEYENGAYIYRYKQKISIRDSVSNHLAIWTDMDEDGWTVHVNPKYMEEASLTTPICSKINEKPIVNTAYMLFSVNEEFYENGPSLAKATFINFEGFDTSNVIDMSYMFFGSQVTSLDLSNFDTSKVTNMENMFGSCQVITLDLNSFDTSKVTNMMSMFAGIQVNSLNLGGFDTSNVTNMYGMFQSIQATILDLSSFDTSKVVDMDYIFDSSKTTTGYAKTEADADRFNASKGKPSTLTFIVKPTS